MASESRDSTRTSRTDHSESDRALVERAQAGSHDALGELFARYAPRLMKVIRLRMSNRLRVRLEDADIAQSTMAAAVRNFGRFEYRNEASIINWLAKLAEHVIKEELDYHMAQKRDPCRDMPLEVERDGGSDYVASGPGPVEKAIGSEEEERFFAALSELNARDREVILLRRGGLSWRGIAELQGFASEDAARMQYSRGRQNLEGLLRESGSDQDE